MTEVNTFLCINTVPDIFVLHIDAGKAYKNVYDDLKLYLFQ